LATNKSNNTINLYLITGQVSSPLPVTADVDKESTPKSPDDDGEISTESRTQSCSYVTTPV